MARRNLSNCYVYVLFREDGTPFYVGKGYGNRWLTHEQDAKRGLRSHRLNVIRQMLACGMAEIPKVKVQEGLTNEQAVACEVALIAAIGRRPNGPLVNQTSGGEGMPDPPAETRAKLRAARLGKTLSAESRLKVSAYLLGRSRTTETRAKMSASMKGRAISPERRAQIGDFFRGKKLSPEHVAKVKASRKNFTHSPESRAKMSAAQRGRKGHPLSAEARAKVSLARRGKPLAPEHRAKLVAAWKRRRNCLTPDLFDPDA